MPIIYIDGKETYVDFVEYERSAETFADKEYKKWLAEREQAKQADAKNDTPHNEQED